MSPMWDELGAVRVPVLLVTGGLDAKYTAVAAEMAAAFPDAAHLQIGDAGHAPHVEAPAETGAAIEAFLEWADEGSSPGSM
jgi:2-succinyl-6-hydroxy-2,4-cyclohexadiene-1-carboxylate synthase